MVDSFLGVMAQELSQRSGQLVQVPNLKATWLLDEVGKEREGATRSCNFFCQETVLTCCHYAGEALSVAKAKEQRSIMLTCQEATESWVDEKRLAERFGPRPSCQHSRGFFFSPKFSAEEVQKIWSGWVA